MTELGSFVDDHPLYSEFKSLRGAVARFQDEAHASAIKFQRHTLDSTRLNDRVIHLERENDLLKAEVAILRANPHPDAVQTPESAQKISELTLSLRKLSQKLDVTEQSLLERTTELTNIQADLGRARLSAENAYALGARVRGREEAGKTRERDLEWQLKEKEEQRRILELAVGEYASLVRSLETKLKGEPSSRTSGSSTHQNGDASVNTLSSTLLEGKIGLHRLVGEFQKETEALQVRLEETLAEMDVLKAQEDATKKGNKLVEEELGRVKTELEKLKIEDNTAAKMVSRYMQFSQRSTNSLQTALAALKTRHEATLNTLTSQSFTLSSQLRSSDATVSRLRDALDELGLEIMKETYGRRREVTQRIKLLNREERIMEALRRWGRRAEEAVTRIQTHAAPETHDGTQALEALLVMAQDARILLEGLDEGVMDESSAAFASGSKARWILGQSTIDELLEELRVETEKRIQLEKSFAEQEVVERAVNGIVAAEDHSHPPNGHANAVPSGPVVKGAAVPILDDTEVSTAQSSSVMSQSPDVHAAASLEHAKPPNGAPNTPEKIHVVQDSVVREMKRPPSPDIQEKPLPIIVRGTPSPIPTDPQPEAEPILDESLQEQEVIQTASVPAVPPTVDESTVPSIPESNPQTSPVVEAPTPADEKTQDAVELTTPAFVDDIESTPSTIAHIEPQTLTTDILAAYPSPPAEDTLPPILFPTSPPTQFIPERLSDTQTVDSDTSDTSLDSRSESSEDQVDQDTQDPDIDSEIKEVVIEVHTPSATEADHDHDSATASSTPVQSHSTLPEMSNIASIPIPSETEPSPNTSAESQMGDIPDIERTPSVILVTETSSYVSAEPSHSPTATSPLTVPIALSSPPSPSPSPPPPEPHRLLASLSQISKRYDLLQRSFRDCHLALESLKSSLRSQHPTNDFAAHGVQPEIFKAALDRLDDYTEDARVELEIRVSDEALLIRGYETLLSVPGAFSSSTVKREELAVLDQDDDEPTQNEVELQIIAFVEGTDPAVKRAHDTFTRKLEDVQHDIAALKRAIHDPEALLPPPSATAVDLSSPIPTPSSSSYDLSNTRKQEDSSSKGGWTSWIRGTTSRPSSPAPQASTFGSIMTAPRLRSSTSTASLQQSNTHQAQSLGYGQPPSGPQQHPQGQRRGSFLGFGMGSSQPDTRHDPLAPLALRVPMPNFGRLVSDAMRSSSSSNGQAPGSAGIPTPHSAYGFNLGLGFPGVGVTSPTAPGSAAGNPMRARTVSTMYMLGLGASGSGNSSPGANANNAMNVKGRAVSAGPGFGVGSGGVLSPGLMSRQNSQASTTSSSHHSSYSGAALEKVDAGETDVENMDAESEDEDEDEDDIE